MFDEKYVVTRTLCLTHMLLEYSQIEGIFERYAIQSRDIYEFVTPPPSTLEEALPEEIPQRRKKRQYQLPSSNGTVTATSWIAQVADQIHYQKGLKGDTLIQLDIYSQKLGEERTSFMERLKEEWMDLCTTVREESNSLYTKLGAHRQSRFFVPPEIKNVYGALQKLGAVRVRKGCYHQVSYDAPTDEKFSAPAGEQSLEEWLIKSGERRRFSREELVERLKLAVIKGLSPSDNRLSPAFLVFPHSFHIENSRLQVAFPNV